MHVPSDEEIGRLASMLTPEQLGALIDHTNLSPIAKHDEIKELCQQARDFGARSVCVNADYVLYARSLLEDSQVRVTTVVGFPLGQDTAHLKAEATREAYANGAGEVDMVIDISSALEGDYEDVRRGIREVLEARDHFNAKHNLTGERRRIVKVIVETCYLLEKEIIQAVCRVAKEEGADFVKSSTGFGQPKDNSIPKGATNQFISWMREAVGQYDPEQNPIGVKASGGVGDARQALKMLLAAGILKDGELVEHPENAVRIGASKGHAIVKDFADRYKK